MSPPLPTIPLSSLATSINAIPTPSNSSSTPSTKARKPPISDPRECSLKELVQYRCNAEVEGGKEGVGRKAVVLCKPVVRLFRVLPIPPPLPLGHKAIFCTRHTPRASASPSAPFPSFSLDTILLHFLTPHQLLRRNHRNHGMGVLGRETRRTRYYTRNIGIDAERLTHLRLPLMMDWRRGE
ncbi:hypothetical protein BCR34DRAFT_588889 [Clohesyomyces aquaticus]|uniref:Uncharacterized protein n=1 Tax=Clohesyomyces aquaticus TaxID=1231657 RepID=A0A1Y1ZII8_9PLEO|nr:hypothetical protein BCR34DRAFT_588889 [Clohesyomyces aquaticus]